MSTRALVALVRKDIVEFLSDPRAVTLSFAAPIILATFFAFVLGGSEGGDAGPSEIDVRLVDEDGSKLSRQIIAAIEADPNLNASTVTLDAARQDVRKGTAAVAVVIPSGFGGAASKAMFSPRGEKPELLFLYDPTHNAEKGMVRGILTQHVMQAVSKEVFSGTGESPALAEAEAEVERSRNIPAPLRSALQSMFRNLNEVRAQMKEEATKEDPTGEASVAGFGGIGVPYATKEVAVTAGNQGARVAMRAHAFGGMAVQFVLFAAIEGGIGLLTERQRGIWKRLRAAPLSRLVLLGSRAISGAIVALLITAAVFLAGSLIFGIRIQGGPLGIVGFLAVALGYALTASAIGLLIAALGKTPQAARGVSVLLVLVMVMLGGAWMPRFLFPGWLQPVTAFIPTRWAMDGFDAATVRAESLFELLGPALVLYAFAAVISLVALARFRWEAE
jgi:ABC-2 type transport system permease protein